MIELSGIILIVYLLFWAVVNACTSWFLDFCLDDGNIFFKYRLWLERNFIDEFGNESFWFKPLGGCVVCMNIWLSVPMYLLSIYLFKIEFSIASHIIMWLFYAVISNTILRKLL